MFNFLNKNLFLNILFLILWKNKRELFFGLGMI